MGDDVLRSLILYNTTTTIRDPVFNWQVMYNNSKENAQLLDALNFGDDDLAPANYSQVCGCNINFKNVCDYYSFRISSRKSNHL